MKKNVKVTFNFKLSKKDVNKYVIACKDEIIKIQQDEISKLKNVLKTVKGTLEEKLDQAKQIQFDAIDDNQYIDNLSETLKNITEFETTLGENQNE